MKKILSLLLVLGSAVLFVPQAQAKAAKADSASSIVLNAAPQIYIQRRRGNRRGMRRGVRVVNRVRIVRRGYRTYREVVQYRYLPNGRVNMRVISRTRIR